MRILIFPVLLLAFFTAQAQDSLATSKNKLAFYSVTQLGILEGEVGTAFQVQTVNGVAVGPWHAGLGVGIDKYGARSIPAFLQLQYQLPVLDRSFSVYFDGGKSFTWMESEVQQAFMKDRNGWYWDAGLQFHWRGKKSAGPVFSLGYSEKTYGWEQSTEIMCFRAPCPGYRSSYHYLTRRISLKAGFKL